MRLTYRFVLTVLRFASDISGKLPARGDGPLQLLVKLLAIADSAEKTWGRRASSPLLDLHDVRERSSAAFTKLFWETDLHRAFAIRRLGGDPHHEFIEARAPNGERLFFQEYRYNRIEISPEFWHTPRFDFEGTLAALWDGYPDGLYLAIEPGEHGAREVKFCAAPPLQGTLWSRVAEERLARHVARHRTYVAASIHRCYLALGPPRCGKTSFAIRLARAFGGRLLNLDASSLPRLSVREIGFLLDALAPQFLVIDDFDVAPEEGTAARLRFLLAHLKATRPECCIVITVNDASKLDPALLQSGRIDEPIDFDLPGDNERAELLDKLLQHHGVTADLAGLITATAGYSHAALGDLVERLRWESLDDVLRSVNRLRDLAAAAETAAKAGSPDNPKGLLCVPPQ